MQPSEPDSHLSRIVTHWSVVFEAHQGEGQTVSAARQALLCRYCGAVYRYLLGSLRDADAAEELSQEFALRILRGDFKKADPERGRFRNFVKTALYHLIVDHQRARQKRPAALPDDTGLQPVAEPTPLLNDQEFVARWREELLDRAWESLAEVEKQAGGLPYTVLRWRAEHPKEPLTELAEALTQQKGKAFTEVGVRQTLHRAREKFADLLLEEVGRSLETAEAERIEEELIELALLPYCRPALERRGRKGCGRA